MPPQSPTGSSSDQGPGDTERGPDYSGVKTDTVSESHGELHRCYANLEIPYGSDLETAKTAWRRLMKRYHPDLHGQDPRKREIATELTRKLTVAYRRIESSFEKQGQP